MLCADRNELQKYKMVGSCKMMKAKITFFRLFSGKPFLGNIFQNILPQFFIRQAKNKKIMSIFAPLEDEPEMVRREWIQGRMDIEG